jgi:hypothetical protein
LIPSRTERQTIAACDRAAWESHGWTLVREQPAHLRGTDLLMERESVDVPASRVIVVSVESRARLDAYARAIGSTRGSIVEGWIATLAPVAVIDEAMRARGGK